MGTCCSAMQAGAGDYQLYQ